MIASLLGLLLVTQLAGLIVDIQTMAAPWNWLLGMFGLLCVAVLGWITYSLIAALLRLRDNPGVNGAVIQALRERHEWRRLAVQEAWRAEQKLRDYLCSYNLGNGAKNELLACGLSEAECDNLSEAKARLLDDQQPIADDDWLEYFERYFQSVLDDAGQRLAQSVGQRVAIGTAVSPVALVDQAIVFYASMKLIRDLAVIYNVRPMFGQTVTLFARSIVQTYLGGEIECMAEQGAEAAFGHFQQELGSMLGTWGATLLTAKSAEAIANGVLICRLGKRTQSFLQPISPSR